MKPINFCLPLAALALALPGTAQTNTTPSATLSRHSLPPAEIAKILSGVHSGHGAFPLTPQELASRKASIASDNDLDEAGEQALHFNNFVVAEADYKEAIQLNPRYPYNYYGLGEALNGEGKTAEAIAAYRLGIYYPLNDPAGQIAPNQAGDNRPNLRGCCGTTDAVAWLKCALLLSQTGQNIEAFSVYSQALPQANDANGSSLMIFSSVSPPSPSAFQAAVHIALGLLIGGVQTNHEQAMTEFDQALRLAPDSDAANYYYGYGWRQLDPHSPTRLVDAPQAKAALQKAAKADNADVKAAAQKALKEVG